jgi:hypothetical protein
MFRYHIVLYVGTDDVETENVYGIVIGQDFEEAIANLVSRYRDELEDIKTLRQITPDSAIEFHEEDSDVFDRIEEEVVW